MKSPFKNEKVKKVLGILNKKWIKVPLILLVIVGFVMAGLNQMSKSVQESMSQMASTGSSVTAEYLEISSNISSTGIIEPLDTYNVTSLIEGEVITADFEEGDQVAKDQILYQIDTDSISSNIEAAQKSIERAERSQADAQRDYKQAQEMYDDLEVRAGAAGQIIELTAEVGDLVSASVPLGTITDNATMVLKIPFNSQQVGPELIGKTAMIQLQDTLEQLQGVVVEINQVEHVLTGGRLAKMVEIEVTNPGGLTPEHTATASIDDIVCSDVGSFEAAKEKTILAKTSGEVVAVHVKEGDMVGKDQVLISLDRDPIDKQLQTYQKSIDAAKDTVEDSKTRLEDLQESLENYQIKAPISGQIINKEIKAGDNISPTSMTTMAVIYDMSAFRFKMSIDELDVLRIEVGQAVSVTADALPGEVLNGYVENISLESTNTSGIAQYPVTVRIDEIGSLLPGMTVNGEIQVGKVENALAIPSMALMRGNVVYLRDDSVTEAVGDVPVGYREVTVEVGVMNDDYVEILSGLNEGDEVYIRARQSTNLMDMMVIE